MSRHPRLGAGAAIGRLPPDILEHIGKLIIPPKRKGNWCSFGADVFLAGAMEEVAQRLCNTILQKAHADDTAEIFRHAARNAVATDEALTSLFDHLSTIKSPRDDLDARRKMSFRTHIRPMFVSIGEANGWKLPVISDGAKLLIENLIQHFADETAFHANQQVRTMNRVRVEGVHIKNVISSMVPDGTPLDHPSAKFLSQVLSGATRALCRYSSA
jgi:hypothetical protein